MFPASLRLALPFALALLAGCANNALLTKNDYAASRRDLSSGDAEGARLDLPRGEEGGFITTMERTYLALLQGKPDIDALARQAKALDGQVRYYVSREAKTFFYLQTPEDYYASEHEIIWMHMLLSWGYSLRGRYEDACVEARITDSLLSLPWSPVGRFDDPAMRVFVAGLWAMCGNWREAQVDLRAARALDNSLAWANELADRNAPPAHLFLVLGGVGPEPYWDAELGTNPLRAGRRVAFRLNGRKSRVEVVDRQGLTLAARRTPDAAAWYERHLARNNEIQELIADSHYGKDVVEQGTVASVKIGASTVAGILWGVGGVAVGGAVAYLGARGNSGEAVVAGLSIAAAGIGKGWEVATSGIHSSTQEMKERIDPSVGYRYVRFLPDYLWMAWTDAPVAYPVQIRSDTQARPNIKPVVGGRPTVSIGYLSDVRQQRNDDWRRGRY